MKIKKYITVTAVLLTLAGCGSSDTNAKQQNQSTPKASHGYYLDSAVVGAHYICGNIDSKTNSSGEFKFYKGDSCKFFIGNIKLREVDSSKLYNGVEIFEDNLPVARVLQTLDKDGNPDKNGIEIASDSAKCLKTTFNNKSIQNSVSDEDIDKLYNCLKTDNNYKGKAVTLSEAKAHIQRTKGNKDSTPPVITLNGDNPLKLEAGDNFTDPGATATDNIDGSVAVTKSGVVNNKKVANYTITYSAKDSAGNEAKAVRVVKVIDTTPPTISLKGDNPIILPKGATFNDPGVDTSDNAIGDINLTVNGSVDRTKIGEYSLIYTAIDSSGNEAKATRVVKVIADENNDTINLKSQQEYQQKLEFSQDGNYSLKNAPKGMAIYPNGTVTWTPTNEQAKDYNITVNLTKDGTIIDSKVLNFHITNSNKEYDGVFVNLSGKSNGDGTPQNPYGTYKDACLNLNGKHNIYLRGAVYKNPGYHSDYSKSGRYPAIGEECQGTQDNPIVIRPWGNEYVKLKTDALYGVRIKPGAKHITVQNLEIEGEADKIRLDEALKYWWLDSNDTMQSSGIVASGDDIIIKDNVVHEMPGSGISASGGAYATIEGNIVYNCDWWTIAGSKGIGITSAKGSDANGQYKNKIVGNLILNIEQRVFSHVWKKGFASLRVDEGEAFLIQEGKQVDGSDSSSYNGKYLVKDNLIIYNGKASSINLAKDINLTNNSYYNNGGATKQSGFRISHTKHLNIANNAVESNIANTIIYSRDHSSSDINLTNNYAKGEITKDGSGIAGITSVSQIFKDPANLDFSIISDLPQNIGANSSAINNIKSKLALYNIKVHREHMDINKTAETKYIVEHAPGKIDCSHYTDSDNPYVLITDINSSYPLVKDYNITEFKLYIDYNYGKCNVNDFTISKSSDNVGDIIANLGAHNSQGDKLTYTIIGDTPFIIDEDGNLIINDSLEVKDYEFDVKVSDGANETIRHIVVHSTVNTQSLSDTQEAFLKKARAYDENKSVNDLINSFLIYAHKKAQNDYGLYISKPLDSKVWQFIEDNPTIKEGLYASRFPVNPYSIKNLGDFLAKWKEDGKSDEFIQKYKNVALGLAINAKERGIFSEAIFGDTGDHRVIDYLDIPKVDAKIKRWVEHLDFKNLGFNISLSNFRKLMAIKFKLSRSEKNSLTLGASKRLKQAIKDGYSPENMSYKDRKKYNISFDEMNLYRLAKGLNRANCNEDNNPCVKINEYIANENNATIDASYVLEHFQKLKDKIGLINARSDMDDELASKLGILPKEQSSYRLMPFYDLANWKIANDNIAAKDFGDDEPNWPLFNISLSKLPWQILALEQNAQKQECQYVKSRFFETDKSKLIDSYPPNAVDGGKKADKRFIQYTTYTWDYDKPKVWFRKSDWTPHRSIYRILQDGGVCGRQSTMGQHVNECLNRPSIGVGQPGHRAWVGIFLNKDNPEQFQTDIGYQVGSRESATPHSNTIYNQYTSAIRATGLERFTGVATGVSPANGGEHKYNQSMILQHIGKILADEGSASAEAVLKKAVDLVPQNVDAWYQLALYYAKLDKPEKIIALAKDYMQKRDNFFMEPDSRKGAENLEVVTGKNIAFAINKAPSINEGKGDNAQWGLQALNDYLNKYEAEYRSVRSYRDINRYLSNYYLIKEQDSSGFENEVKNLFKRFVNNTSSGRYDDYFNGVNFEDVNKTELFNSLQDITDSAQISDKKRDNIYEKILKRDLTKPLAEVNVNDICIDNNLSKCQSVQEFTLDAKAIYILADSKIGEDKEVSPTDRGKEGYSTLTVATTDDLGHDKDIIIRMAKVDTDGKLLKINDPSEVNSDSTKVIAWISPEDNSLEDNRIYTARQRVILKVKKRVTNNEKKMGTVILDINNLMQGVSRVINKTEFTSETIKDNNTSVYFVTLKDSIGATKGVWWKKGYTTLKIPVADNSGNKFTIKLRAYNDDDYKMNSGLSADWDNTLSIKYLSKDNPNLVSSKEYKTIQPFTIDAKMWHKDDKLYKRYYFSVDLIAP